MSCRLFRWVITTLVILAGVGATTPAANAQVCIHPNAPSPLEICVQDTGSPGVWLNQSGTRVNQYYGDFSWHSLLALNGTSTAHMFSTGLETSTALTPVSNTLSGSGTAADPFVITTLLNAGSTGVQVEQKFSYVTGDRYFKKRWTIRHTGATAYNNVRFFHGGDTYFGGDDSARSWWNASSRMVYVNNNGFSTTGYMGFYASPVTPSAGYFGGNYGTVYSQMESGQLSNTTDSTFLDAGYALQWNRTALTPGQTWVIEAFETWSAPGSLQVLPPSDDAAASGTTVRRRFGVHNLHASTASGTIAVAAQLIGAPAGWSASVVGGGTLASLNPLASSFVDVDITIPAGAAPGTGYEVRLTADPAASGVPNGVSAFKLSVLSNDINITPDPLAFGNVLTGTTVTRTITVANAPTGTPLRLGAVGSTNPLAAPFAIVADTCSYNPVAPGASCTVSLSFTPTSGAAVDDSFDLAILEPIASLVTIPVSGNRQIGGTFTVTPTAGVGGTISPATPQVVAAGTTASFTVSASAGYFLANVTGCAGSLSGTTYTIASVNTDCEVQASFYRGPVTLTSDGAGQSTLLYDLFPHALTVTVRDANNAFVQNAAVTFAAPASGATAFLSSTTAFTDAQGRAAISASANGVAGHYQVSATALGVVTLFDLTNVIQPAQISAIAGTPQSAAICTVFPTQLRVRVLDASNPRVPVGEVPVTFSAPGTGASARLSATTVVTDSNGEAAITATANSTTGAYTVTAAVSGIAPATFSLTNSAGTPCNLPGAPTGVGATAGNGEATVTWQPPASDGGVAITDYQVTVSPAPGGGSATRNVGGTATSFVFTNLENGTAYTFTVRAINSVGTGPASSSSAPVTPTLATTVPGVPTSVSASGANGQAVVSWAAPADTGNTAITGYSVQVGTAAGGPFTATSCPTNSPATSCTVGGLTNGVTYYFRVAAINAVGTSPYSAASAGVTPATAPGAVGSVTVTSGAQQANVSWTPPGDTGGLPITGYQVQIATNPNGPFSSAPGCPAETAASSCTATGLTNGTTYYFRVAATTAAGTGAFSPVSAGVTPATAPGQVSNVSGTSGNGQVSLAWTAPADTGGLPISGYLVKVGTDPAGPFTDAAGCPSGDPAAACTVTGLNNGTTYYFRVAARNAAGTGAFSPVSAAVTPASVPGVVSGLTATFGNEQVSLAWTAPADNGGAAVTGYRVEVATDPGGPFTTATGCPGSSTAPACVATGLVNGTTYYFRVAAINVMGTGAYSSTSDAVTPATVPGAVSDLVGVLGSGQVTLSWTPPADTGGSPLSGYLVEVADAPTGPFASAAGCAAGNTAASCTATGLANGTTYYFRVAAVNGVGAGPYAALASGVTPATLPGIVTGLTATYGNQQVALVWTAPAEDGGAAITGYQVELSADPAGPFSAAAGCAATTPATACTATGLTNGTTYYFRVAALNSVGTGPFSVVSGGVTPATVPGAITGLAGTTGDQQVTLTWTAPDDNGGSALTGYQVEIATDPVGPFAPAAGCAVNSTATSCVAGGLTNGTTYYFRVAAVTAVGAGAPSATSAGLTPATVPGPVANLAGTPANQQVTLAWSAPSETGGSALIGYDVQIATDAAGPFSAVPGCASAGMATTCVATGLTNGTLYYFRVAAINGVGTGPYASVSSGLTPATVPGPPTNITVVAANGQVEVHWNAPLDNGGAAITRYELQIATSPNGPFVPAPGCGSATPSCTVTGLTNTTTYYFRVAATNAMGTSTYSEVSSGVTPVDLPGTPAAPTATALSRSAVVTVTPPATGGEVTSYTVTAYVEGTSVPAGTCTVTGSSGSCTVHGLINGTRYVFRATAHNGSGTSSPSEPSAPVTPRAPGPTELTVISLLGHQVTLIWELPAEGAPDTYEALIGPAPGQVTVVLPLGVGGDTDIYTTQAPTGIWYVRLRGKEGDVATDLSNEVRVVIGPHMLPSAPEHLRQTVSGSSLSLSWRPTFDGMEPTGMRVIARSGGAVIGQRDFGAVDHVTIPGVPAGEYEVSIASLAGNTAGPESTPATVAVNGSAECAVPGVPTRLRFLVSKEGRVLTALWQPPADGGAATSYRVLVEGAYTGSVDVQDRVLTAPAAPGVYHLRVVAQNACGVSAPTNVRTVVVQ